MKKRLLTSLLTSALIISSMTLFTACTKNDKLTSIKQNKTVVMATSAEFAPFEFHVNDHGKDTIVGADVEIAKEIAKDLGVELKISDMDFEAVLTSVQTAKVDMGVAGISATPERMKSMDFSEVYYTPIQTVLVRTEDKDKIKTIADLHNKKIGAQIASIQESVAKDQLSKSPLITLGRVPDLVLALQNKKIDALVLESPVAELYQSKNSSVIISDVKLKQDEAGFAIALPKGNQELLVSINKTIKRLKDNKLIDKYVADGTNQVK